MKSARTLVESIEITLNEALELSIPIEYLYTPIFLERVSTHTTHHVLKLKRVFF